MTVDEFKAFVVDDDGGKVRTLTQDELGDGDVTIKVTMSGVNYKDGLAAKPGGRVARISPLVPGIDLVGTVVDPGGADLEVGDSVLVHGYDLGVAHHGGLVVAYQFPGRDQRWRPEAGANWSNPTTVDGRNILCNSWIRALLVPTHIR